MMKITSTPRDGCGHGCQEVHLGGTWIGAIMQVDGGWCALPDDGPASWHPYERDAVQAVTRAHRRWVAGAGQITQPTMRHLQVLAAYAGGGRRPDVARELHLSESTVASYLVDIRARLGARTTCHAVALAYESGLLPAARATLPGGAR